MNQVSDSGMVEFMVEIDKNQQKDKKKGQNDDRQHIPPYCRVVYARASQP